MIDEKEYVKFKLTFNNETIEGFVDLDEIDDDAPLQFYDNQGFENGYNIPDNPYNMNRAYDNWLDHEILCTTLATQDILQYLVYFADEHKEIILDTPARGGEVKLIIN